MAEAHLMQPELPNIITLLFEKFPGNPFFKSLYVWEHVVYSLFIAGILILLGFFATRKLQFLPGGRLQAAAEFLAGGLDDFICGILGPAGRRYTPFLGTLFFYILFMNLSGLIPFLKPSTSSWSTTLALAICVFLYVQYSAIRKLGFLGYLDHLAGKPRGILGFTIILPVLLFLMHILSELIKPISLSLRLRSNIWGDDLLLAVLANFGLTGVPLLLFNTFLGMLTAVVQAVVFCLLSTIYFAVFLLEEEEKQPIK
ncbi:MAG: F0F1 ATP synthase subunit A [Candidatus Omnitrophica bacterium]|nr:F0F1 ATP synthase subunit A [Candidatus Omnitrophota bacterium]